MTENERSESALGAENIKNIKKYLQDVLQVYVDRQIYLLAVFLTSSPRLKPWACNTKKFLSIFSLSAPNILHLFYYIYTLPKPLIKSLTFLLLDEAILSLSINSLSCVYRIIFTASSCGTRMIVHSLPQSTITDLLTTLLTYII